MELEQLNQLTAIASCGTLTKASEHLHLSQSALSRSIQRLEEELGCPLFDRTRNHMELNDAGRMVLDHARAVMADVTRLEDAVAEHLRKRSTLRVGACAPAPLWRLVPAIAERDPNLLVVPRMMSLEALEHDLMGGAIDFAILPYELDIPTATSLPFMEERLYSALPPEHPLAERESLSMADLDGETFLMYQGVGFWRELCERHMPHSHYVLQDDYLIFSQLSQTSPLPGFVTDASETERFMGNRRIIPITDEDATVTYHLTAIEAPGFRWQELMDWIAKRL